ncbi:magnetosome-associated protein MamJ-like isoform X2 [Plodia interpunctella]|nr:magnetosome-associated protein MamJ-like isoform X2 [Plodia interpunctella]
MKMLLLTLFVALVASAPIEDSGDAVEVVVNGLQEGQALEVADIVDIKLKEHADGQVAAATDLLHPFSAVGLLEAAAAAEIEAQPVQVVDVAENIDPVQVVDVVAENEIVPIPIVLPSPVVPEVPVPEPAVLPEPDVLPPISEPAVLPEAVVPEVEPVPSPVVIPEPVVPEVVPAPIVVPEPVVPEVVPSPVVIPDPVAPEVVPSPVVVPEPEPEHQFGEVYNDGTVQVSVNAPEDAGIVATLQSWLSVVMNYFNDGAQTTQQIV